MPEEDDDDFVLGDSQPGDNDSTDDDSGILVSSSADPGALNFVRQGRRAVVGFNSLAIPDEMCIANYRQQLLTYIQEANCDVMAFELAGIKMLPSGMLGLLVTLQKRGVQIELLNPIPDIVEVLRITRLDSLLTVRRTT